MVWARWGDGLRRAASSQALRRQPVKVELDPDPASPVVHPLNDFELATRLSYFLWRSMPDDELLDLAAAGHLQDRDVLATQVARMMDDPKAESLVDDFAGQWLYIRAIDEVVPDVWYYPDWNDGLKRDMRTEAEMTFRTLYMEEDQSLLGLLDRRETFINETLASHYGIPGVTGNEFRRVDLTGTDRVGWITQGALLTSTSYATRTSPVRRGQWVMNNLLCRDRHRRLPASRAFLRRTPRDSPFESDSRSIAQIPSAQLVTSRANTGVRQLAQPLQPAGARRQWRWRRGHAGSSYQLRQ